MDKTNAIQQVIKELSLDYANDSYLNAISSNYGLNRPLYGFSNDLWRAVTKVVALQYKQIYTKFIDVLQLILGPQKTLVATLKSTILGGHKLLYLNDASHLPQIGVLVLDKGLPSEETISYNFIDYTQDLVYLNTAVSFQHDPYEEDREEVVLEAPSGTNYISCSSTDLFPTVPFSLVVGRGTAEEHFYNITSKDNINKILYTSVAINEDYSRASATELEFTSLSRNYATGSFYLTLVDLETLPDSGVLLLGNSSNTFTTTSAIDASNIGVAASTFRDGGIAGYKLMFTGNITPGLANRQVSVLSNTTSSITFTEPLPITPTIGDTFYIRPVVSFTGKSTESDSVNLKYPIQSGITLLSGTTVEVLQNKYTAVTSQVAVLGVDWDVIQNTPNLIEILLPQTEQLSQNLRTASYIHSGQYTASTTLSSAGLIDDTSITVTSSSAFTNIQSGLLKIDDGGPNEEIVAFAVDSSNTFSIPHKLTLNHSIGETVDFWQTYYTPTTAGATPIAVGDFNVEPDSFPGPYVYSEIERPQSYLSITTLNQNLAAPTKLSLGVVAGAGPKVLEVEDASLHPQSGTYSAFIKTENFTVTSVYLKSKSKSTTTALVNIGDSVITMTAPVATKFPNASGYRVIIDRGTASAEIAYVIAVNTGLNLLSFENPLLYAHSSGATVELVRDCLVVTQIDNNYSGIVSYTNRVPISATAFPEAEIPAYDYINGESVSLRYSSITLTNASGFDVDGGKLLLCHGNSRATIKSKLISSSAVNATSVSTDTLLSRFPTTYPYYVEIDYFNLNREIFSISNNASGVLTFSSGFAANHAHNVGASITYIGGNYELIDYNSRSGNVLTLSSPTVVQYNHQSGERAALALSAAPPSTGFGYPFRIPVDFFQRIKYLADLIRAAGVRVEIIFKR